MQQLLRTFRPEARSIFRGQLAHTVAPVGSTAEREQQQQTPIPLALASPFGATCFVPVARRDASFVNSSSAWALPPDRLSSGDCMLVPWTIWPTVFDCPSTKQSQGHYVVGGGARTSRKKSHCKKMKESQTRKQSDLAATYVLESFVMHGEWVEPEQKTTIVPRDQSHEDIHEHVCTIQDEEEPKSELSLAAIAELTDGQAKAMISWLLDGDAEERNYAMGQITGLVWQLCVSQHGSRVVQKAFEVADSEEQFALAAQLKGRVREASKSPHANYVLQKCIELLPPERVQFMVEELSGRAVVTARHRFGCRILQRLIEHCPSWQTSDLIAEVMTDAHRLCRHPFGNFVLQHILEHGTEVHQSQVVDVLIPDSSGLARHRIASHVLQRALVHSPHRERLSVSLLSDADEMKSLVHSQYGSFVMREIAGKR